MQHDNRVRYSPELGVWTVDMGTNHYMGGSVEILAAAMHYARENGEMPECTCFPLDTAPNVRALTVDYARPPQVHTVLNRGGGAFTIYGHGSMGAGSGLPEAALINASTCPLANADGEERARRLAHTDMGALFSVTQKFPDSEIPALVPPEPGTKAPKLWEGETVDLGNGRTVPARHVPADVRAEAAKLATLRAEIDGLNREAIAAKQAAENAPTEARNAVAEARTRGEALGTDAVTKLIRDRRDAAEAAEAVAGGADQAATAARSAFAGKVEERRTEWLSYLHAHAAHDLGRLDLVLSELASVLEDLAEIDRVRQTVEDASAARLFSAGSMLGMGNAVESVREAREKAAATLAPLAAAARKAEKVTA